MPSFLLCRNLIQPILSNHRDVSTRGIRRAKTVLKGLSILGLKINDIDLLITHSPFGDEHMNPHHIQASKELFEWTYAHKISFGFFSCLFSIG